MDSAWQRTIREYQLAHPLHKAMNWVVPGKLIAGPYLGALGSSYDEKKMQVLQKVGVQHVFDLTTRHDDLDPYTFPKALSEVKRHSSPVIDMDVATDAAAIKLAMGVIGFITAKETPVYVHCWGGHGRTGVLVSLIQAGLDPKVTAQLVSECHMHAMLMPPSPCPPNTSAWLLPFCCLTLDRRSSARGGHITNSVHFSGEQMSQNPHRQMARSSRWCGWSHSCKPRYTPSRTVEV